MTTEKLLWAVAWVFILAFATSAFLPQVSDRVFVALAGASGLALWLAKREADKNEAKLELRKRLKSAGIKVTDDK